MRTLGINCNPTCALLALAVDGAIADGLPTKLVPPAGLDEGERLLEFVDDVCRAIGETNPDTAALLLPESGGRGSSHSRIMPRVVIETLVRVASAQRGIPLQLVSRARVRSRLGLPRSGSLSDHLGAVCEPVGPHWNAGRGLAALAALSIAED